MRTLQQIFWSTYQFGECAEMAKRTIHLFGTPLGQLGQGFALPLTRADTNLREPNRLGYNDATIRAMGWRIFGAERDVQRLYHSGQVQLEFLQTLYDIAPFDLPDLDMDGSLKAVMSDLLGVPSEGLGGYLTFRAEGFKVPEGRTFSVRVEIDDGPWKTTAHLFLRIFLVCSVELPYPVFPSS